MPFQPEPYTHAVSKSLSSCPNEILDEIMSYLPTQRDQYSAMRSCRNLHWPAARQLYRDVSVSDYKARRLFKTIAESNLQYQHFIKSLKYKASSSTDVYLTHLMFRNALHNLTALEHLSILIRSNLSSFLIYILKRSVEPPEDTPFRLDPNFSPPRSTIQDTLVGLPKLRTLRLHGDIRFLRVVPCQNMEKIAITEPMTNDEFLYFIEVTVPRDANGLHMKTKVSDLVITLQKYSQQRILYMIFTVASAFPYLRRLSIRGISLNALDISQMMTLSPPLFPLLDRLEVNQISLAMHQEYTLRDGNLKPMDVQRQHVKEAGRLRPHMQCMTFGNVAWTRIQQTNRWEEIYRENATEEDLRMLPENYPGRPCEWILEYKQPVDIGELKSFYSKHLTRDCPL